MRRLQITRIRKRSNVNSTLLALTFGQMLLLGGISPVYAESSSETVQLLSKARELRQRGAARESVPLLRKYLEAYPKDGDAEVELVWALIQADGLVEAEQRLAVLLKKSPGNADARMAKAMLWRKKGDWLRAADEYQALLAVNSDDVAAKNGLADVMMQTRNSAKAKSLYQEVLAKHPNNYDALMGMGRLNAAEWKTDGAKDYFSRAKAAAPFSLEPDAEQRRLDQTKRWGFSSWYTYSYLDHGRSAWHQGVADLSYRALPNLSVGGTIDTRSRNSQTDALYSGRFSFTPSLPSALGREWEVHGEAGLTPDPNFSAQQFYSTGVAWRPMELFSLLYDYKHMHFSFGSYSESSLEDVGTTSPLFRLITVTSPPADLWLDMHTPGATLWLGDKASFTGRYSFGQSMAAANVNGQLLRDNASFSNYSLALKVDMPKNTNLRLSYANGKDPSLALGTPRTILSPASVYSAYLGWNVTHDTNLYMGTEYEDRNEIYQRYSGTMGMSTRF